MTAETLIRINQLYVAYADMGRRRVRYARAGDCRRAELAEKACDRLYSAAYRLLHGELSFHERMRLVSITCGNKSAA